MTLFLAWLNAYLARFSLLVVIGVFFIAGFLLFATPLPGGFVCAANNYLFMTCKFEGAPMYVLGGVVVTSAGMDILGFWPAMFLTTLVCLLVKLTAVIFQQKVIGEGLGKYVWVRKMVGVNSITIRK